MHIWYDASVPVSLPNEKHTHTHTKHGCLKPEACKLWFNFQPGWTREAFPSDFTLSFCHSFSLPFLFALALNLFCYPISLSHSLSLSLKHLFHQPKSILFSLTCFQLVLLSISYHLPLIPPSLPSSFQFVLPLIFLPFDFPCLLAQLLSLPLPHYLSLSLSHLSISLLSSLCFSFLSASVHPPCLDLLCTHHCSVIQPSNSSFLLLLILCWVSLVF